MKGNPAKNLSRRERQIMDIVFRKKHVTAAEVQEELPDNPSYSTVRAFLRILEEKGQVKHKTDGQKYIYFASTPRKKAVKDAIEDLIKTFFDNSVEHTVAALLDLKKSKLTGEELDRISVLIEKARKEDEENE
ncbi:MAG: BlaI/MecI/CopY family transcriptional regulator [Clostridia bacterium]|nr:BlaI/MecI/CopY family transcriptional regulator [Clostridia bacterium]